MNEAVRRQAPEVRINDLGDTEMRPFALSLPKGNRKASASSSDSLRMSLLTAGGRSG